MCRELKHQLLRPTGSLQFTYISEQLITVIEVITLEMRVGTLGLAGQWEKAGREERGYEMGRRVAQ